MDWIDLFTPILPWEFRSCNQCTIYNLFWKIKCVCPVVWLIVQSWWRCCLGGMFHCLLMSFQIFSPPIRGLYVRSELDVGTRQICPEKRNDRNKLKQLKNLHRWSIRIPIRIWSRAWSRIEESSCTLQYTSAFLCSGFRMSHPAFDALITCGGSFVGSFSLDFAQAARGKPSLSSQRVDSDTGHHPTKNRSFLRPTADETKLTQRDAQPSVPVSIDLRYSIPCHR